MTSDAQGQVVPEPDDGGIKSKSAVGSVLIFLVFVELTSGFVQGF